MTGDTCPECGFNSGSYKRDAGVLPIGSVLAGRYKIGGVIGKGGFGITYFSYDMKLECRVVVKEYYPYGVVSRGADATTVKTASEDMQVNFETGAKRFYDEAKLVAKFNGHPNIVSVHDFFYENDTVYFIMDMLRGCTLKEYTRQYGKLTCEQALYIMRELTNALKVTHSENVLHRDISPDNIMLCEDGSVKLLDFGAARQVMAEQSQSLSVVLKQGFAPLEQYQKKGKQGPWTDIYALGVTIYNSITGDVPEDPMSRLDDDEEYLSNKYNIAEGLWQIINKATMLKREERYQDVFALQEDINALDMKPEKIKPPHRKAAAPVKQDKENIGVTMPLNQAGASSGDNSRKTLPYIAAGLAAVILLVIIICVLNSTNNKSSDGDIADIFAEVTGEEKATDTTGGTTKESTTEEKTTEEMTTEKTTEATAEEKPREKGPNQVAADIIRTIQSSGDYNQNPCFEPLALYDDVDGDGNMELIALYESPDYVVKFEVWYIKDGEAEKIWFGDLYNEVGGNSGSVGIAYLDNDTYFYELREEPHEEQIDTYISVCPFSPSGGAISYDGSYYFESHDVAHGVDGTYILGDTRVDFTEYNALYESFLWKYSLDILTGASGNSKSFSDMLSELGN